MANNIPSPYSGGGGSVTSVTAADTSVVIGGTAAAPTVRTNTLDVIAADHPAAADWSNNAHTISNVSLLANALTVGPPTTFGTFVANPAQSWAGVYNSSTGLYYTISADLPAFAGTSALGGFFNGMGIGGASHGTTTPIFGVLNSAQSGAGPGSSAFTIDDSNEVFTFNSTLDDGSGNMTVTGNLDISTAGAGLKVAEGSNAKQGTAVLNGTTAVVVSNTSVTANSRIHLTINAPGGTPASPYVSARTAGTSFSIKSTGAADTSTVAYLITEPG